MQPTRPTHSSLPMQSAATPLALEALSAAHLQALLYVALGASILSRVYQPHAKPAALGPTPLGPRPRARLALPTPTARLDPALARRVQ